MIKRSLFCVSLMFLCFAIVGLCQTITLPDLDLSNCACRDGKLIFTIINRGPGSLPTGWQALTDVYFNGVKQGFVSLTTPTSTTGGGIQNPGGTSTFWVAFAITSPVTVDFVIDPLNTVKESNEANNTRKGCNLKPCTPLPDLVIDSIGTTRDGCFVAVTVKNLGPGPVPMDVWTIHTPDSAGVYLYVDGKAWGGASIWRFDPARILLPAGGSAEYVSKLSLEHRVATVKAIVDQTGKVVEVDEGNNSFSGRRGCRP
jgi:hypothetical protein